MTISRYLNAKHTAQIDIVVKIAKALSCTVDELVNQKGDITNDNE